MPRTGINGWRGLAKRAEKGLIEAKSCMRRARQWKDSGDEQYRAMANFARRVHREALAMRRRSERLQSKQVAA